MAKRIFKITEEQYKHSLSEGVKVTANPADTNGNIEQAYKKTKEQAIKSGVKPQDLTVEIPPQNESRIITKRQLDESRRKYLKENSQLFTFRDFVKQYKSKK